MEKEKSNKSLIIIIILVALCSAMLTFILVNKDNLITKENNNAVSNEAVEDTKEVTQETKEKLERFITAASSDDIGTMTVTYFYEGVSKLTTKIKLEIAYNDAIVNAEKNYTVSEEEFNKINFFEASNIDFNYFEQAQISVIKISNFDSAYKEFFNETANYTFDEIDGIGCPFVLGMSKELDKIYLSNQCGGVGNSYETEILSYEKDGDYYLVHQKIEETSLETNSTVTYNLLWKFDKDLNFVSTERE